jgi:RimJ/RimL family protein N-acetyltransferase
MELLPLKTERLTLRRFAMKDLDIFTAYRADEELGRYQGWSTMTHEAATNFIAQEMVQPFGELGQWLQIAIAWRETDELIGDIGVHWLDTTPVEVEMGYTIAEPWHKQGLATEALGALIETLFNQGGVSMVRAITDTRNDASVALLRGLGFEFYETVEAVFRGEPCTEHTFIRNRSDKL